MTFDDIKNTLIQAIVTGDNIEVHGGDEGGLLADSYAFGVPTAFRVNKEWLLIYFQNGGRVSLPDQWRDRNHCEGSPSVGRAALRYSAGTPSRQASMTVSVGY